MVDSIESFSMVDVSGQGASRLIHLHENIVSQFGHGIDCGATSSEPILVINKSVMVV